MPKLRDYSKVESRLILRRRGGPIRFYADFRDFADVGGKIEKLSPPGEQFAVTDHTAAVGLAAARLDVYLERRKLNPSATGRDRTLHGFALRHLELKALSEKADEQWLESAQRHLERACAFFGSKRDLAEISVRDVSDYMAYLKGVSNGRGGTLSTGSVVHHLNSLSSLFRRAVAEQLIPMGSNPVGAIVDKPTIRRAQTLWLEIAEMARIIKAAHEYQPEREDLALPCFYVVLAVMALTGMRESEVYGLERDDVDLDRRIISVRPNEWRRLKTVNSERPVPIFSQLLEILQLYLASPIAPTGRLFLPGMPSDAGEERMITDIRKALDKMPMPDRFRRPCTAEETARLEEARTKKIERWMKGRTGPKPKESLEELRLPIEATVVPPLRTKMMRHTYCAARLQTLDNGKPISIYTVAEELGHEDIKMIKKVYAHLGKFRHRGEEVEFRL